MNDMSESKNPVGVIVSTILSEPRKVMALLLGLVLGVTLIAVGAIWFCFGVLNVKFGDFYIKSSDEMLPIGTIVAWHRNYDEKDERKELKLPECGEWTECAQNAVGNARIRAPGSPVHDHLIPDLNTPSGAQTGGGRFLRGGTISGKKQDATLINDHGWDSGSYGYMPHGNDRDQVESGQIVNSPSEGIVHRSEEQGQFQSTRNLPRENGWPYEYVRPVNMSVVWIMRVK